MLTEKQIATAIATAVIRIMIIVDSKSSDNRNSPGNRSTIKKNSGPSSGSCNSGSSTNGHAI